MPLLDFDSLVVCNGRRDIAALKKTLEFFRNIGIRKFIVTLDVDPLSFSQYELMNDYRRFKEAVFEYAKPRGAIIRVAPCIELKKGIAYEPFIKRLRLSRTNKIFIRSPLSHDSSWTAHELNYLLYKQKLKPIFVNFEYNLLSSDREYSEQLYRIEQAAYCLDINHMTKKYCESAIRKAIKNNIIIIPAISHQLYAYNRPPQCDAIENFKMLKSRLGSATYLKLCRHINESSKQIFTFLS